MTHQREQFTSIGEAASLLGVSEATVQRMIRHGLLTRYRLRGRYVRVPLREVLELRELPAHWLTRC